MQRRLVESSESRADILSIWDFIAHGNPVSGDAAAADRVLDAIQKTYRSLLDYPHRIQIPGRDLFRTSVDGFRQYLILYRYNDEAVKILRVFRADLDWTRVIQDL